VKTEIVKNRIAVATFFFVNGFLFANWTARLPRVQQFFDISNAQLGSLLLFAATGAVIAMPFAGWLTMRFGSHRITKFAGFFFCCIIPLLPVTNIVWFAAILFFIIGFSNGSMDVAMNGQAVEVEKRWQKPIMSSFHALFSIGMALGALVGAFFANIKMPLFNHFLIVAAAGLVANVLASFFLIREAPKKNAAGDGGHFRLPTKAILPLGIIGFCGMTGEGAMADWSAIFMTSIVGTTETLGAIAFGVFGTAMTIGRMFGDYFTLKLGKSKLLIVDSILAILGITLLLGFAGKITAMAGLFLMGIGLSTVVPIVYSTAGNMKGVAPSVGIAMATTIGYTGFFVGPPTIGFLADIFTLRIALLFVLLLFGIMLSLIIQQAKKRKL